MHPGTSLTDALRLWPTATSRDWKDSPGMAIDATNPDGSIRTRDDQLARAAFLWQTPATDSFRSRSGERKTEQGLDQQSRSFRPGLPISTDGDGCLPFGPSSRPLWKTPHGIANVDRSGSIGGGGGEFAKQAMRTSPLAQATPSSRKAKLNPRFVEWLMGLPIEWTGSARAGMPSCHWSPRMRSALSRLAL